MHRTVRSCGVVWAAILAFAATPSALRAADMGADTTPAASTRTADPLAPARAAVAARQWPAALAELRKLNADGDADWNNLMGYTLRKSSPPDLEGAQRHYDAALRIDPRHRGALEYSGELALMKGDLATAESRLAALAQLCRSPCEPLDDLKASIARFKADAGKR